MGTQPIPDMLRGGHHNSLGRTQEVVDLVLADRDRLDELFRTVSHADVLVRMRAGDALEKVCREQPDWLLSYVDRLLDDVAGIDQPSVQWHLVQILQHLRRGLSASSVDVRSPCSSGTSPGQATGSC